MDNDLIIREASTDEISVIGFIAQQVWPVAYRQILSSNQLDYMLQLFYSPDSLREQMVVKGHHFLLAELEEEAVGFASFSDTESEGVYKIHKLYVLPGYQHKGIGKALIDAIATEVRTNQGTALRLNVNRNNTATLFYDKNGFSVVGQEDINIGQGYFMNDFIMEKKINNPS